RADVIAQRFEPRSRACLASVEQALAHETSVLRLGHGGPAVTIAHALPSRRFGGFAIATPQVRSHKNFKPQTRRESYGRHTRNVFGEGKISAKLFFAFF